ncbi:MAG: hypothetical protein HOV81_10250 [Kofleriaceae bacterium]|nr:hypothetical protein [Kofleriaceae bacterium]
MIVWANLDCEARWAGVTLPQHVLARISAASALLAAFAPEDEPVEIWAPAAVDPARVKLPNVTMRVGVPARYDLAWASPDAKRFNDRWFSLSLAERLGIALPGARAIASLADLDAHLATLGDRAWVVKARWTAAGRDRAYGRGPLDPAAGPRVAETRTYVSRLIDRDGVVVEPWMERVTDLGWCSGADAPHTLLVDERGGFLGIDLTPGHRPELERVMNETRTALEREGYTGPYTIDAFVYRDGGGEKLHALCELNARHTFGHVAHALAKRFGARALGFGPPPVNARILVEGSAWIV